MNVIIRQENIDDFNAVFDVNCRAFGRENEARLVGLLRESAAFIPGLSLVATWDNTIVGHILFSKIHILHDDKTETESLALAPMAVIPEFQKKGIGGQLIRCGLNKARELRYRSVIVLGHDDYYPRFGFQPAERWGIRSPYEVPVNVFMAQELVPGSLRNASGPVKYPEEFGMV